MTEQKLEARANPVDRTSTAPPCDRRREEGRVGWIALWLLGIPIPVLLLLYFVRGCT